jgi:mannose-6-phosphate isomerase-like protein (cupin superfamily)
MSPREHDERPWGSYTVLEEGPGWKVKRIDVKVGERLSYQRHEQRAEHWMVVAGRARVTLDDRVSELQPGDTVDIPARTAHRIESCGDEVLTFVEIQRGPYLGEDDIERLSDDYGRDG